MLGVWRWMVRVLFRWCRAARSLFAEIRLALSPAKAPSHGRRKLLTAATATRRPQPKPAWVRQRIIRLNASHSPDAGCRLIAHTFNRQYAASCGMRVGKTFVHEVMQRHRYEIEVLRRKLKHRRPRPLPHNRIWAMDLTGKGNSAGHQHMLVGLLEHRSRACLSLNVIAQKSSITLLRCLLDAIERFGKPQILRTDNEAAFTSKLFRLVLLLLGIRHQRSQPAHPWQNGRIERFFGTLKGKLDRWQVEVPAQLAAALQLFRFWYNHVRPHDYLDGATPAEVWAGINPFTQAPRQSHRFEAWDGLLAGFYHLR